MLSRLVITHDYYLIIATICPVDQDQDRVRGGNQGCVPGKDEAFSLPYRRTSPAGC
jgi:hypothetical protein